MKQHIVLRLTEVPKHFSWTPKAVPKGFLGSLSCRGTILALTLAGLPVVAFAQDSAPKPDYTLWETVAKIERYGPRDRTPAKVDTRTTKRCLAARERTADQLMQDEEMMRKLKGKCWVADKREDDTRSQVKWACKDGTTAEIATRIEPPNKLGYMMVFNIPNEGALSITAESMKVADTCVPEAKK